MLKKKSFVFTDEVWIRKTMMMMHKSKLLCFTWNPAIWIDLLKRQPSILCFISPGIMSPGISPGIFLLRKIQIKKKCYLLSIFISAEGTISCKLLKSLLRNGFGWINRWCNKIILALTNITDSSFIFLYWSR